MKKKIKVIFSSHLSEDENNEFIKHVNKTVGCKHEVYCYENHNQYSLSEVYNKALKEHADNESIMVFCHNDIIFMTKNWGYKLLKHFNNNTEYDILGVAGTTHMLDSGVWWQDKTKMMGVVNHTDGTRKWQSAYSNRFDGIRDSVLVDGLFIVVNPDNLINGFDESYKGFHYYDISFCIRNYLDGNNIGVITDIDITHKSIGETNQQWEDNRKQFVEEYKDEFPIIYKPHDSRDESVLIVNQSFKENTDSELSDYHTAKKMVFDGNDVTILANVVGEPLLSKAIKNGISVRSLANAPNYVLMDNNQLQFKYNEKNFDSIYLNDLLMTDTIRKMYPNTDIHKRGNNNIKVNIITRTSNRNKGFELCADSIKNQTYKNIRHIVSYDDDKDLEYIKQFDGIDIIKIDREKVIENDTSVDPNNPAFYYSPHNLYCNELMDSVDDGWIMFLDDDDMLANNNVIEDIVTHITDEDTIYLWKMRFANGNVLPDIGSFNDKQVKLFHIGSPCFIFHSKWKKHSRWDAYKCGDFRFLDKLYESIPNSYWINKTYIQLNNNGGSGKRIDI